MITRRRTINPKLHQRRGLLTPVIAIALLVVMAGVALVLDRLWIESAMAELTTCAEASALAAAGELACDDLLRQEPDFELCLKRGRARAYDIAARNLVAGKPVFLDASLQGDIRFGRIVRNAESGRLRFLETKNNPLCVLVTAHRTRSRNNPVALLCRAVTHQPAADAVERAEASIDNRVLGLRPYTGVRVPALPLAILDADPSTNRSDTWNEQIERRAGGDRYAFDPTTGRVSQEADGIPEIVLKSMKLKGNASEANVLLANLGTNLRSARLTRQIERGWSSSDLSEFGGALMLDGETPVLTIGALIAREQVHTLETMVGRCRICLLYRDHEATGHAGFGRARCVGFIAGRIMSIRALEQEACEIVFQPAVVTTRTAVLSANFPDTTDSNEIRNRYVYKLHLTN
jgi:hypothetical protein